MSARDPSLRRRLKHHYEYLVNELMIPNYLGLFFSADVISMREMETLREMRVRHEQTTRFIDDLLRKSDDQIAKFLEIVQTKSDAQSHIYETVMSGDIPDRQTAKSFIELESRLQKQPTSASSDPAFDFRSRDPRESYGGYDTTFSETGSETGVENREPVNYSTPVEALIKNPPHECILEVARLLDKPDEMGNSWRRLWFVLIDRPFNESMFRAMREGPTCFVLTRWCQMKPTSQATVERLIKALNDIFRNDVARCLEEYCQVAQTKSRFRNRDCSSLSSLDRTSRRYSTHILMISIN
ncbi:uncharacterized protein LOC134188266 [Corticium candelabrum]|uniref:uncharacterized protein LOC134188266 n=1 Tax=Corticium candelabrum TaxID=121492 RepID=UPI002E257A1E|nr:uncharacterized protein LOC134188266 [Corticium candelabrum]